jgi:hypothetical protein
MCGNNSKTRCQQFCLSDVLVNTLHLGYGEVVPLNRQSNCLPTRGIGCSDGYANRMNQQIEFKVPSIPDATPSQFQNEAAAENMISAL